MPIKTPKFQGTSKKSFFSSFRNVFLISLLVFIGGIFATQWFIEKISKKDIEYGLLLFQKDWSQRLAKNEGILRTHFNIIYNSLRTIALLPDVQHVDRYGNNFGGSEITVQQIYNTLFSSISVSEIYLIPESFEPDRLDPNTGLHEAPIKSFDSLMNEKSPEENNHQEAVKTFQYREMRKQIDYFRRYFPNTDRFKNMNFPALISPEIITADDSDMTENDFEEKNDKPRQGIVYSIPFYASDGAFRGIVAAVVRTSVLAKLLEYPYFILTSNHGLILSHPDTTERMIQDIPDLLEEEELAGYAYIKSLSLDIKDEGKWRVIAALPDSIWLESSIYKSIKLNSRWIWIIGILLSLSFSIFIWSLMYSRTRALNLLAQMQSAFEASQRRLFQTQKSDLMNKILQQTADDFQSHITPILAYSNLVLGKLNDLPGELKQMEVVRKSAERASQVINQLLSLSRKEAPEKSRMSVAEVVVKSHKALSQMLNGKAEVALDLDPQLFSILGTSSQIEKVIMNLGFNARDAMPEGGRLTLVAKNHREAKSSPVSIPQLAEGFYVKIVVSDTGTGITEDVINKMFDSSSQTKSSQVDIGEEVKLFTVHAIVADHRGILLVHSEVGKGTTFTVYFPALVDNSAEPLSPVEEIVVETPASETVSSLTASEAPPVSSPAEPTVKTVENALPPEPSPEASTETTPPPVPGAVETSDPTSEAVAAEEPPHTPPTSPST